MGEGSGEASMGRVAFASFIGTAIEFYDFYIYGTAAALAFAVLYGPMGAYLPELFGTRLRYSGASVSYNLGGVLGGAFAPILASSLLIVAGGSWAISLYIALMALLSLLCIFFLSETHLADISGMREEERGVLADGGVVPE
jgi:MFS family permease